MQTLFDTHCHLYNQPLVNNLTDVLTRAHAASVCELLVPGVDRESSRFALELARTKPGVYATAGYHPDAVDAAGIDLASLSALINEGSVCAIGEIGLDSTTDQPRGPHEEEVFRRGRLRKPLPSMIYLPAIFGMIAANHVVWSILRQ